MTVGPLEFVTELFWMSVCGMRCASALPNRVSP